MIILSTSLRYRHSHQSYDNTPKTKGLQKDVSSILMSCPLPSRHTHEQEHIFIKSSIKIDRQLNVIFWGNSEFAKHHLKKF